MAKYLTLNIFILTVFIYSCGTYNAQLTQCAVSSTGSFTVNAAPNESAAEVSGEIVQKDYVYKKTFFGTHEIEFEIHLENIAHGFSAAKLIEKLIYQNLNLDGYAVYLENRFLGNSAAADYPPFLNEDGTQYVYHSMLTENYKIEYFDESFVIIAYDTWYYNSGAAHGYYCFQFYIIDIAAEKIMEISDLLLPVPDSVLKEIIFTEYGIDNFLRDNIWPPDTININPEGIQLLWNVYTITPYAAGYISINIPDSIAGSHLTERGKQLKESVRKVTDFMDRH